MAVCAPTVLGECKVVVETVLRETRFGELSQTRPKAPRRFPPHMHAGAASVDPWYNHFLPCFLLLPSLPRFGTAHVGAFFPHKGQASGISCVPTWHVGVKNKGRIRRPDPGQCLAKSGRCWPISMQIWLTSADIGRPCQHLPGIDQHSTKFDQNWPPMLQVPRRK